MPFAKKSNKSKPARFEIASDLPPVEFDEYAILLWRTSYLGYEFAAAINELFDINLERQWDDYQMPVEWAEMRVPCPYYLYVDSDSNVTYRLFENPFTQGGLHPYLKGYDKLLVIAGEEAYRKQAELCSVMSKSGAKADPFDIRQQQINEICAWFYEYHSFDMRIGAVPSETLFYGVKNCSKMQQELVDYFTEVLINIELTGNTANCENGQHVDILKIK